MAYAEDLREGDQNSDPDRSEYHHRRQAAAPAYKGLTRLPQRASMALNRDNENRSGTAGHLSEIDRAARRPT